MNLHTELRIRSDSILAPSAVAPRRVLLALAAVIVILGLGAWSAAAEPGAYRLLSGRIVIWPPGGTGHGGVAVVQGDDGGRYFVQFTDETAVPGGLGEGEWISIVGREGFEPNQITAATVERRSPEPSAAIVPKGKQEVPGLIEAMSGSTVMLKIADGRSVAVDVSLVEVQHRPALARGKRVTVTGLYLAPGLLVARDVAAAPKVSEQR